MLNALVAVLAVAHLLAGARQLSRLVQVKALAVAAHDHHGVPAATTMPGFDRTRPA